jgi:hypothetical protein
MRGIMELRIEYTDKEITPWGGLILLKKLFEKTGMAELLESLPLPKQGSNRGYNPVQLLTSFFVSVWCGAARFEHLEVTRQDDVVRRIFGWHHMAGHKAFQRYFKKFSHATNQRVFPELYRWFFKQIRLDNYTLDLDSTIMTRYGNQEGASVGYNPKKPGRKSHHPLLAFVAECRMVANFWLRPGNSYTTNNFRSFLEDTLNRLEGKQVGLLRADSGFSDQAIFEYLEHRARPIQYIIAARFYQPLQRIIASHSSWWRVADGIEIAETQYQAIGWKSPRRLVMIRQHIPQRPAAAGKTLRLFEDDAFYKNYRYSCFITNVTLPAEHVWRLYRQRADAENRIKELKADFAADSFSMQDFYGTEAALNFVMMAYNLMSLFRQVVLQQPVQSTMKTIRYQVLAIGSYLVKDGNATILKLSLAMKRRRWFSGLWDVAHTFPLPYVVPT